MAMRMPALGVRQGQPADKPRELAILPRPDKQVPVVGHEAIGQQAGLRAFHGLCQHRLEGQVIRLIVEDAHPRVGPIEHVVNITALSSPMSASHTNTVSGRWPARNRFLTPFPVSAPPVRGRRERGTRSCSAASLTPRRQQTRNPRTCGQGWQAVPLVLQRQAGAGDLRAVTHFKRAAADSNSSVQPKSIWEMSVNLLWIKS